MKKQANANGLNAIFNSSIPVDLWTLMWVKRLIFSSVICVCCTSLVTAIVHLQMSVFSVAPSVFQTQDVITYPV